MRLVQVVSSGMRRGSPARTRLFFSCQASLTHPAHSQPSTRCFENVSTLLPSHSCNIRAPHVCLTMCVSVFLTGSGLNYLSGFSWMSSPYSPPWSWIRNLCCLRGSVRQTGAQRRQPPLLEICEFMMFTCLRPRSPTAAANQRHRRKT